jgi:hypothetical protein
MGFEQERWAITSTSFGEKRKYPRFFSDAPLEYSTAPGSRLRGGYAGNMSEGGLLLYAVDNLNIGTEMEMAVFYPDGYRLANFNVLAQVVWKDCYVSDAWTGYQYGVKFRPVSQEDREKVRQLLSRTASY